MFPSMQLKYSRFSSVLFSEPYTRRIGQRVHWEGCCISKYKRSFEGRFRYCATTKRCEDGQRFSRIPKSNERNSSWYPPQTRYLARREVCFREDVPLRTSTIWDHKRRRHYKSSTGTSMIRCWCEIGFNDRPLPGTTYPRMGYEYSQVSGSNPGTIKGRPWSDVRKRTGSVSLRRSRDTAAQVLLQFTLHYRVLQRWIHFKFSTLILPGDNHFLTQLQYMLNLALRVAAHPRVLEWMGIRANEVDGIDEVQKDLEFWGIAWRAVACDSPFNATVLVKLYWAIPGGTRWYLCTSKILCFDSPVVYGNIGICLQACTWSH